MIYLHKILPIFLLPVGFTIILAASGLAWRERAFCWAGVILLFLSALPFTGNLAMRAIENGQIQPDPDTLPPADAVVVLSGGLTRPSEGQRVAQWSGPLVNRFEAGVALYLASKAPKVMFTNGRLPWRYCQESIEVGLLAKAQAAGIDSEAVITTGEVVNTAQEAAAAANILLDKNTAIESRKILLVTSAFHMRRAKLLFERAGFIVIAFPADFRVCHQQPISVLDFFPTADGLTQTETALREWYGFLYYRFLKR